MKLFPSADQVFPQYLYSEYHRIWFLNQMETDAFCIEDNFTIDDSFLDFLGTVRELHVAGICKIVLQATAPASCVLVGVDSDNKNKLLIQFSWQSGTSTTAQITATTLGAPETARTVSKYFRATYPERFSRVRWYFLVENAVQSRDIVMEAPSAIKPEYYPFFPEDPDAYLERFLAHSAPLLFFSGPPGTGKTTLLRHFLYKNRLRAIVSYEDLLLTKSDQMFVTFITSSDDVMIIEDADLMLSSREHSGNTMISRFLNASDGLIKTKKKIIFTTNLYNFGTVDNAIVRAGRSFGAVEFRALSPDEAVTAANVAGITDWSRPDRPVTIAEIFNPGERLAFGKHGIGILT